MLWPGRRAGRCSRFRSCLRWRGKLCTRADFASPLFYSPPPCPFSPDRRALSSLTPTLLNALISRLSLSLARVRGHCETDQQKEVERRRRETINTGINELKAIVPSSNGGGGGEKPSAGAGSSGTNNKGAILREAVAYIHQLRAAETTNIEKWTLEKMLGEQRERALQEEVERYRAAWEDRGRELDRLRGENERLRAEVERLSMGVGVGRSAGGEGDGDEDEQARRGEERESKSKRLRTE